MRGTDAVEALAELMPVADGVDERVDWAEVEAAWGTRFPSDYVRFMEVYGSGVISGGISILLPALRAEGYPYRDGPGLRDETENARETWEMCRDDADFDVDPESIVAWAVTSGRGHLLLGDHGRRPGSMAGPDLRTAHRPRDAVASSRHGGVPARAPERRDVSAEEDQHGAQRQGVLRQLAQPLGPVVMPTGRTR